PAAASASVTAGGLWPLSWGTTRAPSNPPPASIRAAIMPVRRSDGSWRHSGKPSCNVGWVGDHPAGRRQQLGLFRGPPIGSHADNATLQRQPLDAYAAVNAIPRSTKPRLAHAGEALLLVDPLVVPDLAEQVGH